MDECLLDELVQLRADRIGARREELGEEQRHDLLHRVDPEDRAGGAAPRVLAFGPQHLVRSGIEDHREAEPEADPVEARLGEQRTAVGLEVGVAGR